MKQFTGTGAVLRSKTDFSELVAQRDVGALFPYHERELFKISFAQQLAMGVASDIAYTLCRNLKARDYSSELVKCEFVTNEPDDLGLSRYIVMPSSLRYVERNIELHIGSVQHVGVNMARTALQAIATTIETADYEDYPYVTALTYEPLCTLAQKLTGMRRAFIDDEVDTSGITDDIEVYFRVWQSLGGSALQDFSLGALYMPTDEFVDRWAGKPQ